LPIRGKKEGKEKRGKGGNYGLTAQPLPAGEQRDPHLDQKSDDWGGSGFSPSLK